MGLQKVKASKPITDLVIIAGTYDLLSNSTANLNGRFIAQLLALKYNTNGPYFIHIQLRSTTIHHSVEWTVYGNHSTTIRFQKGLNILQVDGDLNCQERIEKHSDRVRAPSCKP